MKIKVGRKQTPKLMWVGNYLECKRKGQQNTFNLQFIPKVIRIPLNLTRNVHKIFDIRYYERFPNVCRIQSQFFIASQCLWHVGHRFTCGAVTSMRKS